MYLFVAIDRTLKFAFVELHQRVGKMVDAAFLRHQIAAVPYRLNIVLTDNGIHFTNRDRYIYAFAGLCCTNRVTGGFLLPPDGLIPWLQ